ncbi:MAG: 16S rRNA (uracil(1498)-N(3))-methyltransferase [Bacteroidia bacterium]|nr:16S rRNA (uracil(1498)-N(3))-methyltransferase [Bacteroidia bacterium]
MHWFYCTDIRGQSATLDEVESRHCIKSLRLSKGDEIIVCDGSGSVYKAEIVDPHPKKCKLQIMELLESKRSAYKVHIALAPTKQNERTEWFLEKATEIGFTEFSPILCSNSERRKIKLERFDKILISALKQSHQALLPKLNDLQKFSKFIENADSPNKFIAHCRDASIALLQNSISKGEDALILIGPEGDFTEEEVELAIKAGFKPISLGKSRLRTETAGIVAVQTLAFVNS